MIEAQITPASIRFAALNLLSMREHSFKELTTKLNDKFNQSGLIKDVLIALAETGLQSDERFADAFARQRIRQGKGPILLAMELSQRGICNSLIEQAISADVVDWNELAAKVRQKKFGEGKSLTPQMRAKQIRFLASRGFKSSHIQFALNYSPEL